MRAWDIHSRKTGKQSQDQQRPVLCKRSEPIHLYRLSGPDPEVSSNGNSTSAPELDRNSIANGRTITVGLNITF